MTIRRALGTGIATTALAIGGLAVTAGSAAAGPPLNYGDCVQSGQVNPQDGFTGPSNSKAQSSSGTPDVGALHAYRQSDGNSRFPGFTICQGF